MQEMCYLFQQCVETYHEPHAFRANLNSLIQTMRNVTFRIQTLKDQIPEFDSWYWDWQRYLATDDVMIWLKDARTTVVHKKGLGTRSRARVRVIDSYRKPSQEEQEFSAAADTSRLVRAMRRAIPREVRPYALVEVTREWRLEGLKGEILESLSHGLHILGALMLDLQRVLKGGETKDPADVVDSTPVSEWLVPSEHWRTIRVNASTGAVYSFVQTKVPANRALMEAAARRYNLLRLPGASKDNDPQDYIAFARSLIPMACTALTKDRYHLPMVWLRTKSGSWLYHVILPEDQLDKYLLWQRMGDEVRRSGVDAVVGIAEAWMAPLDAVPPGPHPKVSESRRRREVLHVYAEGADGQHVSVLIPFKRLFGHIILRKPVEHTELLAFLQPIREAWASNRPAES